MDSQDLRSAAAADTATILHRSLSRLLRVLKTRGPRQELSGAKLAVLGRLRKGGPCSAANLAGYLRVKPQSLTRLLEDLEHRGFITKRASGSDRRRLVIAISGPGSRALAKAMKEQRGLLARAIQEIISPKEIELLRQSALLLDRLSRELGDLESDGR